jgi:hypothetical protein
MLCRRFGFGACAGSRSRLTETELERPSDSGALELRTPNSLVRSFLHMDGAVGQPLLRTLVEARFELI